MKNSIHQLSFALGIIGIILLPQSGLAHSKISSNDPVSLDETKSAQVVSVVVHGTSIDPLQSSWANVGEMWDLREISQDTRDRIGSVVEKHGKATQENNTLAIALRTQLSIELINSEPDTTAVGELYLQLAQIEQKQALQLLTTNGAIHDLFKHSFSYGVSGGFEK